MKRAWGWLSLVVTACSSSPTYPSPPPCATIPTPGVPDSGVSIAPTQVSCAIGGDTKTYVAPVWGFADLHAHPATEIAFGGRFIWGHAIDDAPVDATQLPMIDSCPVETHDKNASAPVDHYVGDLVFPQVTKIASFAHAPVGALTYRPSHAWPNARDIIHQQMNVSSIRRAYEGGLRLMFASTTDNQVLSALLAGPAMINGFVPDPQADYASAQKQLELIDQIVAQNPTWMGIARSPCEARSLISQGKLALVLSVEMDGLEQGQIDSLVSDFGVRHVLPVHLIDNGIGGTAVNSDIFNAASALVSPIYRCDQQELGYMDVEPSTAFSASEGWPQILGTVSAAPIYAQPVQAPFPLYHRIAYEPLPYCDGSNAHAGTAQTSFIKVGQVNHRGLCTTRDQCDDNGLTGAKRIGHMMKNQLFIDVTHMGYRAVQDTLAVVPADANDPDPSPTTCSGPIPLASEADAGTAAFPVIASHGDVANLCKSVSGPCNDSSRSSDPLTPATGNERSIDADQAREVADRQGVLGLGLGSHNYRTRSVFHARGGPLLSFGGSSSYGCVAASGADGTPTAGCKPVPSLAAVDANADQVIHSLQVQTLGGVSGSSATAIPFVQVELLGPDGALAQNREIYQPMTCSTGGCTATVVLPPPDGPVVLATANPAFPDGPMKSGGVAVTNASTGLAGTSSGTAPAPYTVNAISGVTVLWSNVAHSADATTNDTCTSNNAPSWTIESASVVANPDTTPVDLVDVGPFPESPVATTSGSFTLFSRWDRVGVGRDVQASGHLFRITMSAGGDLAGANDVQAGANVCAALRTMQGGKCAPATPIAAGATECPTDSGWTEMNQRGAWPGGNSLYAFARYAGAESDVCGADVEVLDWDSSAGWTVNDVQVEAIEDPLGHFLRRYVDITNEVAHGRLGAVALGTDMNGFNGMMDLSECPAPTGGLEASSCAVLPAAADGGPPPAGSPRSPLAPMRLQSGGSLGDAVRIEERGLATYGLLADMMSTIETYPGCGPQVYRSLMLSAEATIRAWENIIHPGTWSDDQAPHDSLAQCGLVDGAQACGAQSTVSP